MMKFCTLCRRSAPDEASTCSFDGCPLIESAEITPAPGEIISRYRLVKIAALGDAGTVYLAEDVGSKDRVALKLLSPELCDTKSVIQRIRRESKNAIKLSNPHVASVRDCGEHEGRSFIVREWLEGQPLSVLIREEMRMETPRALAITHQICTALSLIHRVGLVHRDLKPNHVFMAEDDGQLVVKLIDIGVAAQARDVSNEHLVFGCPGYLSPEAALGKMVSPRSDLYSLGCLLYELLVGTPAFLGNAPTLVEQHASSPPPRLSEILPDAPSALDQLLTKMLSKQATARPFNASIVQREIARIAPRCAEPILSVSKRNTRAPNPPIDDLGMAETLYDNAFTADQVMAAVDAVAKEHADDDKTKKAIRAPQAWEAQTTKGPPPTFEHTEAPATPKPIERERAKEPRTGDPSPMADIHPYMDRRPAESAKATMLGLPVMSPDDVARSRSKDAVSGPSSENSLDQPAEQSADPRFPAEEPLVEMVQDDSSTEGQGWVEIVRPEAIGRPAEDSAQKIEMESGQPVETPILTTTADEDGATTRPDQPGVVLPGEPGTTAPARYEVELPSSDGNSGKDEGGGGLSAGARPSHPEMGAPQITEHSSAPRRSPVKLLFLILGLFFLLSILSGLAVWALWGCGTSSTALELPLKTVVEQPVE